MSRSALHLSGSWFTGLHANVQVNLCVGELSRSALHLAAQKNLPDVTLELLRFGGDVEVRDALHLQPLALTTDYRVRQVAASVDLIVTFING